MLFQYDELQILPLDLRRDFGAHLHKAQPTGHGAVRLVGATRTTSGALSQRITVQVLGPEAQPAPGIDVGFFFSSGRTWLPSEDFAWSPPHPWVGDVFATKGSGEIDHIQGSAIKQGQRGGITVSVLHPLFSSDVITGAGMLADHTGLFLTYMVIPTGYIPLREQVARLTERLKQLESVFYG